MSLRLLALFAVLLPLVAGIGSAYPQANGSPSPARTADTSAEQTSDAPTTGLLQPSLRSVSLWGASSLQTGSLVGNVSRSEFGVIGLRYNRRLGSAEQAWATGETMLVYTADIFPLAYLSIPPNTVPAPPENGPSSNERRGRASGSSPYIQGMQAYGIGGSPVGIRLNYRASERLSPFVSGSAGLVYFLQPIPDERGKHLNFTFDVGLGLQFVPWRGMALSLGYRYHHLSNGFRGQINPGVDANLLYLGISVWQ